MSKDAILIAAYSGRALARAARRVGFIPFVADLFHDEDMRACAAFAVKVRGGLPQGFDAADLLNAVARMKERAGALPSLVYGAGFENRPDLLAEINGMVPLRGNDPETVRAVKNPAELAGACASLGIPHPEIRQIAPEPNGEQWLLKSAGSAGGAGTKLWRHGDDPPPQKQGHYWQRLVPGGMWSVLFVADGREARIVGFSQQWTAPCEAAPFRFGGAATAEPPPSFSHSLTDCAQELTRHFRLRGLNSIDLMADGRNWWLIEINPRPGATLDLFDSESYPLMAAHIEGCAGRLPQSLPHFSLSRAAIIAYADRVLSVPAAHSWPACAADIPAPGTRIEAGSPICTIFAQAPSPAEARISAQDNARRIVSRLAFSPQPSTGSSPHAALVS